MLKTKAERMQFIHDFIDAEMAAIEAAGRKVTVQDGEAIAQRAAVALRAAVMNRPGARAVA